MSHRSGETEDVHDRRPRGRDQLRSDQDGRTGTQRSRCEVQPAAAHRGAARRVRRVSAAARALAPHVALAQRGPPSRCLSRPLTLSSAVGTARHLRFRERRAPNHLHSASTRCHPSSRCDREPDSSRFADFTRADRQGQATRRRRGKRWCLALVALVIAAALVACLVRAAGQELAATADDLARKHAASSPCSTSANAQLAAEVSRLQTPDGIKEAAREEVGYVGVGEIRISILRHPRRAAHAAERVGRTTRSARSSQCGPRPAACDAATSACRYRRSTSCGPEFGRLVSAVDVLRHPGGQRVAGSILGNRVLRKEDPKFLTTGGMYVDDLLDEPLLAGAAHVTYVRSTVAHGRHPRHRHVRSAWRCRACSASTPRPISGSRQNRAAFNPTVTRGLLAIDKVRFVGEPVAVVVTEDRQAGRGRSRAGGRRVRGARGAASTSKRRMTSHHPDLRGRRQQRRVRHDRARHARHHRRRVLRRLRGGRHGPLRQPARRAVPARGARLGRRVGARDGSPGCTSG